MELKIDKEWIKDAVQPTIDRIKAEYIHKSVIEDIKAEIISLWGNDTCSNECGCLDEVFEIIDKHTAESEDKE